MRNSSQVLPSSLLSRSGMIQCPVASLSDPGNLAASDIDDKAAVVMMEILQMGLGHPDSSGRVPADASDPT
jgi:hypothetical protein